MMRRTGYRSFKENRPSSSHCDRFQQLLIISLLLGCPLLTWYSYSLSIRLENLNSMLNKLSTLPDELLEVQTRLQALRIEFDLSRESIDLNAINEKNRTTIGAVEYVMERLEHLGNRIDDERKRVKQNEGLLSSLGIRLADMEALCVDSCKNGRRAQNKMPPKSRVQKEIGSEGERLRMRQIVFNRVGPEQ
ncbi:unnamed protein product, partial [Mesorhabditis belari]|uniref:Uncharacterized protein n=1 Tax=Mesorhabditis belari TaxID=2138241 RepID=A0AAF3EN35_9BILA